MRNRDVQTIRFFFHLVSTLNLPPLQGVSIWVAVPRVKTLGEGYGDIAFRAGHLVPNPVLSNPNRLAALQIFINS
jgi:hypothetical protein